jgi:hypothetical protein
MRESKDYKTFVVTESEWAPKTTFDKQNNFGPVDTKQSFTYPRILTITAKLFLIIFY